MTVKATSKPRRLSQKQRAEKLSVRFKRMAEIQAEIEELQAQEDAYQAKKLDEAWKKLRSDMEKTLGLTDADGVEALRQALVGPGVLPILKVEFVGGPPVEPVEGAGDASGTTSEGRFPHPGSFSAGNYDIRKEADW